MSRMAVCARIVLFVLLIGSAAPNPSAQPASGAPPDLASFFGPRGLVRDSNGDALNDRIAARIIVPATPSREDGLTAANIAARLGFETTSMSLPLVLDDNAVPQPAGIDVPILVGPEQRVRPEAGRRRRDRSAGAPARTGPDCGRALAARRRRRPGHCRRRRQGHPGGGHTRGRAAAAPVEHDRGHADRR